MFVQFAGVDKGISVVRDAEGVAGVPANNFVGQTTRTLVGGVFIFGQNVRVSKIDETAIWKAGLPTGVGVFDYPARVQAGHRWLVGVRDGNLDVDSVRQRHRVELPDEHLRPQRSVQVVAFAAGANAPAVSNLHDRAVVGSADNLLRRGERIDYPTVVRVNHSAVLAVPAAVGPLGRASCIKVEPLHGTAPAFGAVEVRGDGRVPAVLLIRLSDLHHGFHPLGRVRDTRHNVVLEQPFALRGAHAVPPTAPAGGAAVPPHAHTHLREVAELVRRNGIRSFAPVRGRIVRRGARRVGRPCLAAAPSSACRHVHDLALLAGLVTERKNAPARL